MMSDIIDGTVWRHEMQKLVVNGRNSNVPGFLMNTDWFQPFKHISYLVGIYAVIFNVPRNVL